MDDLNKHRSNLLSEFKSINNFRKLVLFPNKLCCKGNYELMTKLLSLGCGKIKDPMLRFYPDCLKRPIAFARLASAMDFFLNKKHPDDYWGLKFTERDQYHINHLNLINNCLFVVMDIKLFIDEIRKQNPIFNINEGVQAERGEVNEMHSFLNSIEIDYLDSLYNNYIFHTKEKDQRLPRSKFSIRNMRKISRSWTLEPDIIYSYTEHVNTDTE